MKTPEEMALEYAEDWHKDCDYPAEILRHTKKATETVFLAGYKAGCTNTQSELAVGREVVEFLLEKPQWISVKDRLPEIPDTRSISEDVLWLTRYGEMEVSCLERLRSEFRVDWGEAGLLKLDQFTHWMPLPEPPEE